jgi:hypothetical protein
MTLEGLNDDFQDVVTQLDAEVNSRSVPIIGRAALVKNKTAAGRPKDVADVARLTKTAQR